MFKRKSLGFVLGSMLVVGCYAGEACYLSQPESARLIAACFTESVVSGEQTRSFHVVLDNPQMWDALKTQSKIVSETNGQQQFFSALSQIFGDNEMKVTDDSIYLIIQAAQQGCKDADDIIVAAWGNNFSQVEQCEVDGLKIMISDIMENTMHIVEESPVNSAALAGTVVMLTDSITNLLSGDTKYDWQKIIKSNFGDLVSNYEPDQLLEFISPLKDVDESLYLELAAQVRSSNSKNFCTNELKK